MVKNLSSIPAFGFETDMCNSDQSLCDKLKRYIPSESKLRDAAKTARKQKNLQKILSYFPLIGSYYGLKRIVVNTASNAPNKYNHIARGCIEFLSLGFLLLIPDLILTAYRNHQARKEIPTLKNAILA